jgi:hypothetical protein
MISIKINITINKKVSNYNSISLNSNSSNYINNLLKKIMKKSLK